MKNLLFFLLAFVIFSSCKKDSYDPLEEQRQAQQKFNAQLAADTTLIKSFLNQHELPYLREENGVYYNIVKPGSGGIVYDASTRVQVKFKALLLDGTVVDSTTLSKPISLVLGNVIAGFQIGIPLIQPGGKVILYIPSGYAFGARSIVDDKGKVIAPANSNFIFELELLQAL
ncbi:peptidylprolyl isomerase [Solitalea longa]|uniref:Peptidyl-prolyl cis-trans isomerase n=1 Tax=Solitalea longa TaxID=2079460 RepID=A0A2S4ZZI7_9SPHI|nr:FKBP-type peptidyl-prolyl cis-trans isomerase [Solitalea longa]POY35760.1 peptidylprolyl isomerase [Solitalea longa]